jgi:hypothetical protein
MRRQLKPPSASTVVALLALFVALGGTGYAAVRLSGRNIAPRTIAGNKFKNRTVTGGKFKNSTLTGKKLRRNTLTGRQVRESRLATVPSANLATSAGSANAITGPAAAGFVRRGKVLDTNVLKLKAIGTSAANSPLRPVFSSGPFALRVACWNAGGGKTTLLLRFTSTEPGSILDGEHLPFDDPETAASMDPDDHAAAFAAPSGATLFSSLYFGIKRLGADCLVGVDGVVSP